MYKVEVPTNGMGDSVTMRLVNLVDRSDEIHLSSQTMQSFNGKLYISGTLSKDTSSGVQIEVIGPDNTNIFGPLYINTNYQGSFSADFPITGPGDYEVSFTDASGYIGDRIITIVSPNMTDTPPDVTIAAAVLFAEEKASRDNPAYFVVQTEDRPFRVYTSASVDWVVEYVDPSGVLHMVNDQGELNPEEIRANGNGKAVYFKVYPYRYFGHQQCFPLCRECKFRIRQPNRPVGVCVPVFNPGTDPEIPGFCHTGFFRAGMHDCPSPSAEIIFHGHESDSHYLHDHLRQRTIPGSILEAFFISPNQQIEHVRGSLVR